jgi:hypothetical protein
MTSPASQQSTERAGQAGYGSTQSRAQSGGYRSPGATLADQWQYIAKMASAAWAPDVQERRKTEETTRQFGEHAASLMSAQAAFAMELLRAPLWFFGGASPDILADQYQRLLEEHQGVWLATLESLTEWQRSLFSRTEHATAEAREAVSNSTEAMKQATSDGSSRARQNAA